MGWNWVTSRIALGSEPTPSDIAAMQRQGITDVLDLRGEPNQGENCPCPQMYANTGIAYHFDGMRDRGPPQPFGVYQIGVCILRAVLADPHRKVLVHCAAGMYRSPSMVYAYLRSTGMSHDEAWSTILAARPQSQTQYLATADSALTKFNSCPAPVTSPLALGALVVLGAGAVWYGYRAMS